jgi:dTDP-4-amino-4,6-dideoxygalactose transaminase
MIEYENLKNLNEPFFKEFTQSFTETLNSGWYILGKNVNMFENDFALYCGSKHCVALNSGLDALVLAIKAFDFPPNTEIIVPANAYIASIIAVILCGFKPVLVEPNLYTYNIDPEKIEENISKTVRAVMVVHLYGMPCEMAKISATASKFGLQVIEDCAQAHGATINGQKVGTFGDINAFSFYPTKNLGALGDAGAITTNSESLADKIIHLRNYGSKIRYRNEYIGTNSRMDELQAGFLAIKLKALDQINSHKRRLASIYMENLKSDFILPTEQIGFNNVYHIFPVRHPKREALREYLLQNDITTDIHYPVPPYKQKALEGIVNKSNYPITDEIHNTIFSVPISTIHSVDQVNKVVEVMNAF